MKYARIENGRVAEVGEFDSIEGRFHPSLVWVECPADTTEGLVYDGAGFSPPPPVVVPAPRTVTMRQARLALLGAGLLPTVDAAVAAMPGAAGEAARIEWEYSVEVQRDKALVQGLSASLGLTEAQLDGLFTAAAAL